MQDLVVVRLIVEKIWNDNVNYVESQWGARYRSRSLVNVPAKSGGQADVSCKV